MRVWSRTLSGRLCRVSSSFSENMAEEDNQAFYNENNRVRTIRDHMNPIRTSAPSWIVFPSNASHFNFKPHYSTFTFFSWLRSRKSILAFERI